MNKLVIGAGAREHAIGEALQEDDPGGRLFFAPGNAGTAQIGMNVPIPATNIDALRKFAKDEKIDLTVVGPEDPLALGIVNEFRADTNKLNIFGATKEASIIETSKAFAKSMYVSNNVPTARHVVCTSPEAVRDHVVQFGFPVVLKADGLALGKGVTICHNPEDVERTIDDCFVKQVHGRAGTTLVVEEYLDGPEVSIHTIENTRGHLVLPIPVQDHKPRNPGTPTEPRGSGPMTGGMGTYAPLPWMTREAMEGIDRTAVTPVLEAMRRRRTHFTGALFSGKIITKDGPKALEENCRFGDPETQVLTRLLKQGNRLALLDACAREEEMHPALVEMHARHAVCLVLAVDDYGLVKDVQRGHEIRGIDDAKGDPDVRIYHAGTKIVDGKVVTNGGRVLGVSATGDSLPDALAKAHKAAGQIQFLDATGRDRKYLRQDIGHQALEYGQKA